MGRTCEVVVVTVVWLTMLLEDVWIGGGCITTFWGRVEPDWVEVVWDEN